MSIMWYEMLSIVMSPHFVFLPAIVVSKHEHFCLYIDSVVFYCIVLN